MANVPDRSLHDMVTAIGKLGVHDHLCLIYETQEEQFSAVIPYVKIGLERGEKCLYVVDDNTAAMVIDGLKSAGVEVETAVESGQLAIVSTQNSYLKQGYFDPDWMIGFLTRVAKEAKAAGFPALRVTGEMTWVLSGDPGTERLMEYEAKLNYFFPENDALAICQYNRNRFPPEIIKNVISTHPLVICGGMVCSNFYYVPPDDFLGEAQPAREIERLLSNIIQRAKVEEELRWHRERLSELVKERTIELTQMNERFSVATRAAQVGVWDWNIPKNELVWDDSMYRLYGLQMGDFGGAYDAWAGTIHPQDKAQTEGEIQAALRGEREYAPEFRIVRPDGTIRCIKADSQTFRDDDGKPVRMIGTNIDITELKHAEEALTQLNEELEHRVSERTRELEQRNRELEQMNRAFVGRELKMVELKERIREMEGVKPDM